MFTSFFYDRCPAFNARRVGDNFAKLRRRGRGQAGGRIDPFNGVDLVAQTRLPPYPAGDERGDDEMGANPVPLWDDRLDMPVEGDDLGLDSDLFHELPGKRGGHRLADFDAAAGKAEIAKQRRPRPAYNEDPPLSKHRRRHR
jgi:hypothetical protein